MGNKTTMRLFYPESASYNPSMHNDPDTLMVLVPFKQQDLRWLKEILYDEKRVLDVCAHTSVLSASLVLAIQPRSDKIYSINGSLAKPT